MPVQFKIFSIGLDGNEVEMEELNRFLRSHRILSVGKEVVAVPPKAIWAFCVEYLAAKETEDHFGQKVDYKEILSESDFAIFARLRNLRKEMAEKDGLPAYALFTNEQLAKMVQERIQTATGLAAIHGVGQTRVTKYGPAFLGILTEVFGNEKGRGPDGQDRRSG